MMMEQKNTRQRALKGKLDIGAILRLETGLHIGASSDFAPIGAVDSPFLRDPMTKQPIIPGSSLKGKIRTLLARSFSTDEYFLNKIDEDSPVIQRLFGSAAQSGAGGLGARLQFSDIRMTEASCQRFAAMELDTYIGEIKFENTISRISAAANPRQIERVPAGAEFDFRLVYNIEDEGDLAEDLQILADGIRLLQMDYLGGHGSRGYGRVLLRDFHVKHFTIHAENAMTQERLQGIAELLQKGGGSM